MNWRQWSGYFAASSYDDFHEPEYHAIRNGAALIDVSPLFKYEIRGRDAEKLVNRLITRTRPRPRSGRSSTCHGAIEKERSFRTVRFSV